MAFLLSPEARDLRPLLLTELVDGFDLFLRDRLRRAYASLPALLAPRLPIFGPLSGLPSLPVPPVLVPGVGFMASGDFVEAVAPSLSQPEEVYLQSLSGLGQSVFGALHRFHLSNPSSKELAGGAPMLANAGPRGSILLSI